MAVKRPKWVDDLEAYLRSIRACYHRRVRGLKRVAQFKTFKQAWNAERDFDDLFFLDCFLSGWGKRANADTKKTERFWDEYGSIWRAYKETAKERQKKSCDLYRKYWPNPPRLPKAKPAKKGR